MKIYLLSLLCLILAIILFQPKQNVCCTGLQDWLGSNSTARAILRLPHTPDFPNTFDNTNSTITLSENIKDGYVFSLPVAPSELPSSLPNVAPEESITNNLEAENTAQTSNSDIISIPDNLSILDGNTNINTDTQIPLQLPNTSNQLNTSNKIQKNTSNLFQQPLNIILFIALIVFVASFLQGATGLVFAMLMMPLLLWTGYSLAEASMFTALITFITTSITVFRVKETINWELIWPEMYLRIAAMAVGIFLLAILTMLDSAFISQVIGLLLLGSVLLQLTVKSAWPAWVTSASDGLLQGMVGFGGPAIFLWLKTKSTSHKDNRAFLTATFWTLLPIQLILLLGSFGESLFKVSTEALLLLPLALVGLAVGLWYSSYSNRKGSWALWNDQNFGFPLQGLLIIVAVLSLMAPYIGLV